MYQLKVIVNDGVSEAAMQAWGSLGSSKKEMPLMGGVDIFTLRLVCRNLLDVGQYALYLANYLTGDMNAGSSLTWLMHAIRVWNVYNIYIYIGGF